MKLYFVRHGQSNANVGGEFDQSVGGALTELGRRQAEGLAGRLAPLAFDRILVSPLQRAVHTALPYLRRAGRWAQVWPELAECRGRKEEPPSSSPLPAQVRYGDPIELPADAGALVRFAPDEAAALLPPPDETYREGQRRARLAADRLMRTFGGTEQTVLMVGHACNGARVIEALMRIELDGRFQHANTGVTRIEQKANGDFIMRYLNRLDGELEA